MPVAMLRLKDGKFPDQAIVQIIDRLRSVIAGALDVPDHPEMRLTKCDIEIWPELTNKFEVNPKDFRVMVFAHKFPERFADIEGRKDAILAGVKAIFADYDFNAKGWVWLHLNDTAFEGF